MEHVFLSFMIFGNYVQITKDLSFKIIGKNKDGQFEGKFCFPSKRRRVENGR